MKKVLSILLSALMLISVFTAVPLTAGAAETDKISTSATSGDFEYYILDDGTAVISDYTGSATELEIPGELDGYTVTSIGWSAFYHCTSLASVTIPDSVTSIGGSAFEDCTSLASVTIGKGVTNIDETVFLSCPSITNIDVDINNQIYSSVDGNLFNKDKTTLIQYASGKEYASFTVPNGVTNISDYAFVDCMNLKSVTIPESVISIGRWAFYDCTNLTSIDVDANNKKYTSVDGILYNKDKTLLLMYAAGKDDTTFVIPDSVKRIVRYAFQDCTSLTSVTIGNGVTSIGRWAFYNCESLTSVTINNGITSIGDFAFSGCKGLASITIPDSVTSIGYCAFYNCENLSSVTISDSVTSIGESAFSHCISLESVTIGNSVTSIDGEAFCGCTSLESITIPDSVTSIGYSAFEDCTSLTSVTIGNSVTSIGEEAFSYCENLSSVTIPDSVTEIGWYAFEDCTSLESVTIGNGITSIDNGAFSGCTNLEKVYYRGTKEQWNDISIGLYNNCLTNASVYDLDLNIIPFGGTATDDEEEPIDIESNIRWNVDENGTLYIYGTGMTNPGESSWDEDIPWYSQRESIKNVVVSEGVTGIGNYSFYNCDNIETISLPASVTYVGSEAFFSGSLENIYVSEDSKTFTSVDGVLFSKDMTEIIRYPLSRSGDYYIPNTVTDIHQGAFRECRNLTKIEFSDSVTSIGWYAFFDCDSLLSVTIPSTITCDLSECGLGLKFHKGWDEKIEGFVIYGESGSAAEEYAYYYGLTFVNINEMPTSDPTESTASTEPPTGATQPGSSEPTEPGTQSNPTDNTESTEPSESTATTDPVGTQPTNPTVTEPTEGTKATTQPATSAKPKTTVKKAKKANPMTVSVKTKTVKAKKLKKAKQTVKAITVSKAKGKVSYAKVKSGTTKKIFKKVTISKNGKITLKRGKYKKGTYKIKVKITAKGNSAYKSKSKTVTVRIKVK